MLLSTTQQARAASLSLTDERGWLHRPIHEHYQENLRRGSAKQSVQDGLGSLWQHGNFNTLQFRNLSSYNDVTLHIWLRPWDEHICQVWLESARYWSLHAYVKYTLIVTFHPFCLPSCLPVGTCFSLIWRFGVILPQNPHNFVPVGKSQPNKKSRMTSKPFKIDIKCQLNMNMKSGSPFQNR